MDAGGGAGPTKPTLVGIGGVEILWVSPLESLFEDATTTTIVAIVLATDAGGVG